ncbi:hypothetical protein [Leifsonia sp. AG29]|uniref:hypothetical protein n=1 Tax=Leifsonia sp. AG29 TaxID=2598860 RepID=UPI00131AB5ED|nr:hypothetical protein [Leifsonia sp. AG29]
MTHHPAPLTDDVIAELVSQRPDTESFGEAVAHVAYWFLVEMQERGASSAETAAAIRRLAEWKRARLAELSAVVD